MAQNCNNSPAGEWTQLETVGDVKRMLRFTILALKDNNLDVKKAAVMGQLANILLRALESSEVDDRFERLEAALEKHLNIKLKQ